MVVVLGDQLTHDSTAFDSFDPEQDIVWMAETAEDWTHVWAHKMRIAFLLSAMRHFRQELLVNGYTVSYTELPRDEAGQVKSPAEMLRESVGQIRPKKLVMSMPGDSRLLSVLRQGALDLNLDLEIRPDRHFFAVSKNSRITPGARRDCCWSTSTGG